MYKMDFTHSNSPHLLSEKQVSTWSGISVKTLQGMRIRGHGIPFIKIGRLVRYDPEQIHAFMEKQTKISTSQ